MKPLIRFLMKHLSIKSRLVLMFLVPGVIYYLFSTALSFSHIQSLSSAKINELQAVIESAIGKTSGQFLSRGLTDDLENVLTSLVDNTAVSGAAVFDVDSSIFAQAGDLNLTDDIKAFEHPIYHQTIVPDFEGIDFNDGVSKSNPVQIGVLKFYVDIESTMDQSWKAAIGDSLMLLITILICSPFFFALYSSLSAFLNTLSRSL